MSLFKKNPPPTEKSQPAATPITSVKVLGSCCDKCNQLEATTQAAIAELGLDITLEHVTDFGQIAAHGVMTTPALVINGKVVSCGKVLKKAEIITLLQKVQAN